MKRDRTVSGIRRGGTASCVLLLLVSTLVPAAAVSGLDPDPDSMGIYYDQQGYVNGLVFGFPVFASTNMYVILMNPTTPIYGAEFRYQLMPVQSGIMRIGVQSFLSEIAPGNDADPFDGWYRLGGATPLPPSSAQVLVGWTFFVTNMQQTATMFFLRGVPEPSLPGIWPVIDGGPGAGLRQADLYSGHPDFPVASTWPMGLPTTTTSFGAVKSLFR